MSGPTHTLSLTHPQLVWAHSYRDHRLIQKCFRVWLWQTVHDAIPQIHELAVWNGLGSSGQCVSHHSRECRTYTRHMMDSMCRCGGVWWTKNTSPSPNPNPGPSPSPITRFPLILTISSSNTSNFRITVSSSNVFPVSAPIQFPLWRQSEVGTIWNSNSSSNPYWHMAKTVGGSGSMAGLQ